MAQERVPLCKALFLLIGLMVFQLPGGWASSASDGIAFERSETDDDLQKPTTDVASWDMA